MANTRLYANNVYTTIAAAITNVATTATLTSATGWPAIAGGDWIIATLVAGGTREIVKITALTGTTITMTRAQESTTAVAWAAGSVIEIRATAASYSSAMAGAGSSTDNAVARFDGTGGATLQNSVVTIGDTGVVAGVASITVGTTTVAVDDKVLVNDTSASDVTKTVTTQAVADLCLNTSGNYVAGGTDVPVADGGTGRSVTVAYAPVVGGTTTTAAMQSVLVGSAGQVLQSGGNAAIPAYSTATYPATAGTARKILVSDGTNIVSSTETYAVPGTSGNVLTSDGTNWTSAAPTGGAGGGGLDAYTTTATAAGTTTLTVSSNYQQYFTGSTTQTVVMPVTSTLVLGQSWRIVNNSTGTVTVQSSGANNIIALVANTEAIVTCILTSGTTAASWDYQIQTTNLVGTGTGQIVRATSPTLITPALGTPASGVLTNCTGSPTLSQVTFSTTSGIIGTTTNDSAAAGSVGQIASASGSSVSMTDGVAMNICSISLTAGDWDLFGNLSIAGTSNPAVSYLVGWISSTSATLPADSVRTDLYVNSSPGAFRVGLNPPSTRFSLSSTTTVYLSAQVGYTGGSEAANGSIYARRRR